MVKYYVGNINIDKQQYTMPASYIPVKVEFKGDPIPSLFVPSTVTIMFNDEGQVIAKCVCLSACSQTPCKQDVAGTLTEAQSMPRVGSV